MQPGQLYQHVVGLLNENPLSSTYVRAKIALYKDGQKGDDPAHLKAYFAAVKTHPTPSRTTGAVN